MDRGVLSDVQNDTLAQLRQNMEGTDLPSNDDEFLLQWLRARSFDLRKSERMLRDHLEFRKRYGVDELWTWTIPSVLSKYWSGGFSGYDKEGCPVWIDNIGETDIKGIFYSVRKFEILKYKILTTEKLILLMEQQSVKHNRLIDQMTLIFDMENVGAKHLWKPGLEMYTDILKILEANYPERLKYALVINAPRIFPIIYNLMKQFLSDATKTKICICGRHWKDTVLKYIDVDQLPVKWGGTMMDPDGNPCCPSKINMGGKVPEEYYLTGSNLDLSQFQMVTVGRFSTEQIESPVMVPGSVLSWQFYSEGLDIAFGVFLRASDHRQKASEMVEVVKTDRVNCHFVPESGSLTCREPGMYILRFDNTYSWLRSKVIYYYIEVLEPEMMSSINKAGSEYFLSSCRSKASVISDFAS